MYDNETLDRLVTMPKRTQLRARRAQIVATALQALCERFATEEMKVFLCNEVNIDAKGNLFGRLTLRPKIYGTEMIGYGFDISRRGYEKHLKKAVYTLYENECPFNCQYRLYAGEATQTIALFRQGILIEYWRNDGAERDLDAVKSELTKGKSFELLSLLDAALHIKEITEHK